MSNERTGRLATLTPEPVCSVWLDVVSDRSETLDPSERARWNKYQRTADRDRFSTGANLQRRALRELCGAEVPLERYCAGCGAIDHGPVRPGGSFASQWSMSLSHSQGLAMVAIAPGYTRVGVDVEAVSTRYRRLSSLVFSSAEQHSDQKCIASMRDLARTRRWCRKEALVKATKLGLAVPLAAIEVSGSDEPPRLKSWKGGPAGLRIAGTYLFDVGAPRLPSGYCAAIAVVSPVPISLRIADALGEGADVVNGTRSQP